MTLRALAALALLVACGGAPTPAAVDAPVDEQLERACACEDDACRDEADRRMAKAYRGLEDAEVLAAIRHQARLTECLGATAESARAALAERTAQLLASEMCACADAACADAAEARYRPIDADLRALVMPLAHRPDVRGHLERFSACTRAARGIPSAEETLAGAAALRDRACACADVACANEVKREVETFMAWNMEAQGTPAQIDQIAAIFRELGECLAKVSEAAPP